MFGLDLSYSSTIQNSYDKRAFPGLYRYKWTNLCIPLQISSGVDVASSLGSDIIAIPTPQPLQTNELFSESISNSPFGRNSNFGVPELSQRENLDLLIQKFDEMDVINEEQTGGDKAETNETAEQEAPSGSKTRSRKNPIVKWTAAPSPIWILKHLLFCPRAVILCPI